MEKQALLKCGIFSILLLSILAPLVNAQNSFPSGIGNYITVNVINYQPTAYGANVPVQLGAVTPNGNFLGFNALAYSLYLACNLQNMEYFWLNNGTVIKTYMVGNGINPLTANGICTSSASPNALVDSMNISIFGQLGVNTPTFLPANTGTANVLQIGLGFANPSTNLLNGNSILFMSLVRIEVW